MLSPRSFLVSRQKEPRHLSTSPSASASASAARKDARAATTTTSTTRTTTTQTHLGLGNSRPSSAVMAGKRAEDRSRAAAPLRTLSPPTTSAAAMNTRPTTPTSPVQIPVKNKSRETTHSKTRHYRHEERRSRSSHRSGSAAHDPNPIPPSVAALLAVTSIPPPRASRASRRERSPGRKRMTVEAIIEQTSDLEKEFSLSLSKSPLDVLLTPPEFLEADDISISDSNLGSVLSTRTVSLESMPSFADSFVTSTISSVETPSVRSRRRSSGPLRRSLEPVSSPDAVRDDPLSVPQIDVDKLDFRVFQRPPETVERDADARLPFRPLKSAFKSNLTASLRALRQAARSFSTINFPYIPPEDFLTRSILTIDPPVPYTDERRPPRLEEEPTAALRRYLNPTTNARIGQPASMAPSSPTRSYTASIQMQTYKVQRSRSAPPAAGSYPPSGAPALAPTGGDTPLSTRQEFPLPGPRQREMRENSDFIRIAVMEMAMRKRGKLDDQRPGRARWALPPRRVSGKTYEVGTDGVPARWVAVTYEEEEQQGG